MKTKLVNEVMIPIANYVTVRKENNLVDVLQTLEDSRKSNEAHAHRDAIVVDENDKYIGKVTMIDIFRALEPNYKKAAKKRSERTLTTKFVMDAIQDFHLWMAPSNNICQRGSQLRVADVMHVSEKMEFVDESDSLERALNLYVMGVHQPLLVKKGDDVIGVLRFGDVFEEIRLKLLACER
jgi:CBS domain containing-hemolysin-like protein